MRLTGTRVITAAMLIAGVVVGRAAIVSADETTDVKIKIRAPIDAVSCGTTSQVTVLGLSIDITAASAASGDGGGSDDGGGSGDGSGSGGGGTGTGDGNSSGSDGGGDDGGGTGGGCAALAQGQSLEVKLASDAAPLTAVEIGSEGDSGEPDIQAPIQMVDATAQTITVLGLTVDVSTATLGGEEDDGTPAPTTLDLTTLAPGQVVAMQLDASKLPALIALTVDVKNFTNEVDVEVEDQTGSTVDDSDGSGGAVDDVEVSVDESVVVTAPPAPGAAPKKMVKKIHFTRTSNGSVRLQGLAKGHAKITVTRNHNGVTTTGRRGVKVHGNTSRTVLVKLRGH